MRARGFFGRCRLAELRRCLDEDGQMIIFFVLLLIPLVLMLALTVDLGIAYAERRQIQNVADSGARAGTAIIKKHRVAGNISGMDSAVTVAIQDIATRASGGLGAFTLGPCSGTLTSPRILGEYVDWNGNAIGVIGSGDSANASGVRLTPCKEVPTNFAKIVGLNSVRVSTKASWVFGVIDGVDPNSAGYGPFAVWYGDTMNYGKSADGRPSCDVSNPAQYCVKSGQTVIFRENGWCEDSAVSSDSSRAPGGNMACDSNNFKGDINHGQGFVNVGNTTSNGGNALGQYRNTLQANRDSHSPMLFPLISRVSGSGSSVDLTIEGFACVEIKELGGGSTPYKAKVLAVGDADFDAVENKACKDLLQNVHYGTGTVRPTSITVTKALQ